MKEEVKEIKEQPQKKNHNSKDVVFAFLLILIGALFLVNNLGIIPWTVWADLWRFWPALLVLWGLQLLLGKSKIAQSFMGIATIAVFVFIILYILVNSGALRGTAIEHWAPVKAIPTQSVRMTMQEFRIPQEEFPNVKERKLAIESGIGKFVLRDGSGNDYFTLRAESDDDKDSKMLRTEQSGDVLNVSVDVPGDKPGPGIVRVGERFEYTGTIGKTDLPTTIALSVGAGEADIQLKDLVLRELGVDVGVGATKITLQDTAVPAVANLDVGVGSIKLSLPENVGIEVTYDVGLGGFSIDNQNLKGDGTYRTQNFAQSERKLKLTVDVGTGSIEIDRN